MTIDLKALRETAAREIRRGASGLCPPQTVIALLDRLEAAEKDAARYRWITANYKLWSWQPTRYNADITSGFAFSDTGYSGYSFEDALTLAMMGEQK